MHIVSVSVACGMLLAGLQHALEADGRMTKYGNVIGVEKHVELTAPSKFSLPGTVLTASVMSSIITL